MKRDAFVRPDETRTVDGSRIGQYPWFRLDVLPNSRNDPTEYTVFPRDVDDPTTEWITAETGAVLPLEECK